MPGTWLFSPAKHAERAAKLSAGALGGLPNNKLHCSLLAADGLKAAIEDFRSKNVKRKT